MTSNRISGTWTPCTSSQRSASPRSRRSLRGLTASSGSPNARLLRVFTSQMTSVLAVARHDVELPGRAPPVACQDRQSLPSKVLDRQLLAVPSRAHPWPACDHPLAGLSRAGPACAPRGRSTVDRTPLRAVPVHIRSAGAWPDGRGSFIIGGPLVSAMNDDRLAVEMGCFCFAPIRRSGVSHRGDGQAPAPTVLLTRAVLLDRREVVRAGISLFPAQP